MSTPERPSLLAAVLPWALLGAVEVYLALGWAGLQPWHVYAGEVVALALIGAVLGRGLPSFPGLAPVLAPALPLFIALVTKLPGGVAAVPYLAGLVVLIGGPVAYAARRRPIPAWLACLLVVPAALYQQASQGADLEGPEPMGLTSRLAHDLTWPARVPALPPPRDAGPPIVVISVDTLRADAAREMASWQRLRDRGAWWDGAMSTSSWTLPALASLQTGLVPEEHGAGCLYGEGDHCQGLSPEVTPVAEALSGQGYATVGITSNPWSGRTSGFERGFHAFHDLGNDPPRPLALFGAGFDGEHHQDAAVVTDLAIDWLDRLDGSFYLWVHYIDPHLPYTHTPELAHLEVLHMRSIGLIDEAMRQSVRDAYAREVAHTDAHVTRLLDALEARGLLDEALVVFTADHGEEMWEHGGFEHGHSHHAEVVEVPLVVSGPGVTPGRRTTTASVADVASTVRAVAGLPAEGFDLRDPLPADRVATAQGNLVLWLACSARDDRRRVIVDDCEGDRPRIHRYDLLADPGEHHPLPQAPDDLVEQAARTVRSPEKGEAAQQNVEALRALGYMQ